MISGVELGRVSEIQQLTGGDRAAKPEAAIIGHRYDCRRESESGTLHGACANDRVLLKRWQTVCQR